MLLLDLQRQPINKQSMRIGKTRSGRTISFSNEKKRNEKIDVILQLQNQLPLGFQTIHGPVRVEYEFCYEFIKSLPKSRRYKHLRAGKPDIDNIQKAINDCLDADHAGKVSVTPILSDDSQIVEISAKKYNDFKNRILIKITQIGGQNAKLF